jgi:uncharacterized membrane protein YphA (DoxX/SURF4 family)
MPATVRHRAHDWGRVAARFVLAAAFVTYAAAKFTGAQFVLPGYLLDTPVADLSGMDLTWAFFAHSPLYSGSVAVGQLVAAALLTFDRTARLGAVVLVPITTNVALVNLGYDIGPDTLALSLVLLALNLYLLAGEFPALRRCFWDETAPDPTGPRPPGRRAAVARAAVFAAAVLGIFGVFTIIMNGPAGGQKAIAGDWTVESAAIDGGPAADPAAGADWLWVCFDPYGRFSVRTKRYTFQGKYTVDPATGAFSASYDPEPLPPVYPGRSLDDLKLTPAEQTRVLGEQYDGFKWPVELTGSYHRDGRRLIVTAVGRAGRTEWVLVPYERPKF